jgi:hypothetical protein
MRWSSTVRTIWPSCSINADERRSTIDVLVIQFYYGVILFYSGVSYGVIRHILFCCLVRSVTVRVISTFLLIFYGNL